MTSDLARAEVRKYSSILRGRKSRSIDSLKFFIIALPERRIGSKVLHYACFQWLCRHAAAVGVW
jgi:hypothetical protein